MNGGMKDLFFVAADCHSLCIVHFLCKSLRSKGCFCLEARFWRLFLRLEFIKKGFVS